jgi:hypothetical protein
MYVNNAWELIGTSATDLTNYYTKAEVDGKLLLKANDSDVVHVTGNETINGNKTFLKSPLIYNPDTSVNDYLVLKNPKVTIGSTTDTGSQRVVFQDKNGTAIGSFISSIDSNGWTYTILEGSSLDSQSNVITRSIRLRVTNAGASLLPSNDNNLLLGSASARWSSIYSVNYYYGSNNVEFSSKFVTTDTNQTINGNKTFSKVNGVEPSSLSLPSGNLNDIIDISSYFTVLDGTANTYVAPANGWISITMTNSSGIQAYINGLWGHQIVRSSVGGIRFLMPILKNLTANIFIFGGTIDNARFIPCQGNV